MKRFEEMDERELMEVRAKMTPEEIMAVVQEEEAEMERLVKGAQILEPSIAQEEQEDDSIVQFNPETGEAVEVESTVVTREAENPSEGFKRKGMVTLVEQEEADFGYFDGLLITKGLTRMIKMREEQEEELINLSSKHRGNKVLSERYQKLAGDVWEEVRMLRSIRNLRDSKMSLIDKRNLSNKEVSARSLRKRLEDLPKELLDELNATTYNLATELLDIL